MHPELNVADGGDDAGSRSSVIQNYDRVESSDTNSQAMRRLGRYSFSPQYVDDHLPTEGITGHLGT